MMSMMLDRHRVLLTQLGGTPFAIPSYTGSHAIFGDEKQGYIECYSTGTITFPIAGKVDVFILGSGLKGVTGNGSSYSCRGGKGGKGAVGTTLTGIAVEGEYTITVGAACSSTMSANKSTAFGTTANSTSDNSGEGASASISGYSGSAAKANAGSNGTSYPFGETSGIFYKQLGAGGGGGGTRWSNSSNGYNHGNGTPGNGGILGGGDGANTITNVVGVAAANTGSGGGGGSAEICLNSDGSYDPVNTGFGGNGGSGIVIIRWGYAA